jgi:transcriptional regulator
MFSQARGRAKVRDQSDWLADQLKALTAARAQMRHIVGIEIEIAALEGKWKVSQNQPEVNRRSVVAGFSMDETTREMAELVRIYGKLE